MQIHIKNLRLRCIIGFNDWEREKKQDVVVNVWITFDGRQAAESDEIAHSVNYKNITKRVIHHVENAEYFLLEKLSNEILKIALEEDGVVSAIVEVDKPHALRFSDSVSMRVEGKAKLSQS